MSSQTSDVRSPAACSPDHGSVDRIHSSGTLFTAYTRQAQSENTFGWRFNDSTLSPLLLPRLLADSDRHTLTPRPQSTTSAQHQHPALSVNANSICEVASASSALFMTLAAALPQHSATVTTRASAAAPFNNAPAYPSTSTRSAATCVSAATPLQALCASAAPHQQCQCCVHRLQQQSLGLQRLQYPFSAALV
jgi:hypothetical protein